MTTRRSSGGLALSIAAPLLAAIALWHEPQAPRATAAT
jgi:hypothetical protein